MQCNTLTIYYFAYVVLVHVALRIKLLLLTYLLNPNPNPTFVKLTRKVYQLTCFIKTISFLKTEHLLFRTREFFVYDPFVIMTDNGPFFSIHLRDTHILKKPLIPTFWNQFYDTRFIFAHVFDSKRVNTAKKNYTICIQWNA